MRNLILRNRFVEKIQRRSRIATTAVSVVLALCWFAPSAAQAGIDIGMELSHGWTSNPSAAWTIADSNGTPQLWGDLKGIAADSGHDLGWISTIKPVRHDCSGGDCDTHFTDIESQARLMSAWLQQSPQDFGSSAIDAVVLVGHSQGTLRNRAALQLGYLPSSIASKTIGLVNIGSPGAGAPVVLNAPGFITRVQADLLLAHPILGAAATGAIGYLSVTNPVVSAIRGSDRFPGFADMKPNGQFISRINAQSVQTCRWKRGWKWVGWLWWRHRVPHWFYVCKRVPADNRIPAHVAVLDIVGTDNNVFHVLAGGPENQAKIDEITEQFRGLSVYFGALSAAYWAAVFLPPWQWWFAPSAIAAADLSYITGNFYNVWQVDLVGSREGDATVPLYSQRFLSDHKYLLENPLLSYHARVGTVHGNEPSHNRTIKHTLWFMDARNEKGAHAGWKKLH